LYSSGSLPSPPASYTLSLHDALPILTTDAPLFLRTNPDKTTIVVLGAGLFPDGTMRPVLEHRLQAALTLARDYPTAPIVVTGGRSEEHTSELQSRFDLVCRLLLEKKK